MGYINRTFSWDFNALKRFYEKYVKSPLAGKQDTLVSSVSIKTINNQSLLGGGNINISGGGGVQSDWNETDPTSDAYIWNKPTIPDVSDFYTRTEVDGALEGKVDKVAGKGLSTEDYTAEDKSKLQSVEGNAQVNVIESISVNGTPQAVTNKNVALTVITNTVSDLVNYYRKSETYTQAQVDALIASIVTLDIRAVDSLPTTDISTTTIYLVPKAQSQTLNAKDEYINTTGTSAGWEKIGDTEIDLSNYVTTTALNAILSDYVTASALSTALNDYYTKAQMDSALSGKTNNSDFTAHTSNTTVHVTAAERTAWNNKSDFSGSYNDLTDKPQIPDVSNYYTKTEVDSALSGKADASRLGGLTLVKITQAQYDALTTKDANTLYVITD